MTKLRPENYDYLWTDYDINYIFTSCYLFKEFRDADMVLIYNWKDRGLRFYLSKDCRKDFSDYGVEFYEKKVPEWKLQIQKNIEIGKKLIVQSLQDTEAASEMDISDLKNCFLDRVNLFQALGGNYFYTEFFFLDEVEQLVQSNNKKKEILAENLKKVGEIKFQAREVLTDFYNYNKVFRPYIEALSKRFSRNDLQWLSFQEILDFIDGKPVPISTRDKNYWILTKYKDWTIINDKKAQKICADFDNYFFNKQLNEIKGNIANKGIHRGFVKVIRTIFSDNINEEIKKVKKGDVLVAATTGPEIMNVCRLAGAIVTDEGGITSHAAIVSRELGIPCIIATKIATKVLKDGDMVEVDAERGVVKILKKAR